MDDVINRVACQEQRALMTEFFESYQEVFPDSTPLAALALVFSIDMKTWKFPEVFHSGPIAPQIEFIENSEALRKLMQEHCPFADDYYNGGNKYLNKD